MADSWKTALHDYVYGLNQMEAERSLDSLWAIVADDSYLRRRGNIFHRLKFAHTPYSLPIRCETRAKPVHTIEQDDHTTVRLQLRKKWVHESRQEEERIEYEKITLAVRNGEWVVTKIDIEVPERRALAEQSTTSTVSSSTPFINRDVLDKRNLAPRAIRYNRNAARDYAELWWNSFNPKYHRFEVDCTSFISQCLFAGGIPMNYTGKRASGWWYHGFTGKSEGWSYSWAVAHSLQTYILSSHTGLRGIQVRDPRELSIGDIISYDWDGDSRYTHSTIVTAYDPLGFPLVNAHTNEARLRYWDYRDSYAWTERTRYTFIHIPDLL